MRLAGDSGARPPLLWGESKVATMKLLLALLAVSGVSAVPHPVKELKVAQSISLSSDFLGSLGGDFKVIEAVVVEAIDSATRVVVGTSERRRAQDDDGRVTIEYYVSCSDEVTPYVSDCNTVTSQLGDKVVQMMHADSIIAAIAAVSADAGFENAVLSSAADVVATVAVPEMIAISLRDRLPGVVASPLTTAAPHTTWKISNNYPLGDQWVISELQFFTNPECTIPAPNPIAVSWSETPYDIACANGLCPLLYDGVCDESPNCCVDAPDGTKWAGNDYASARQSGGTWISYTFPESVAVSCIQMCHAPWANQQVTDVLLQYSDDGSTFSDFEVYYFPDSTIADDDNLQLGGRGDSHGSHGDFVGGTCDADSACPMGMFCNFDSGFRESHCEACSDCPVCGECNLVEAGEASCSASCAAEPNLPQSTTWRVTNNIAIYDRWVVSEVAMFPYDSTVALEPVSMSWSDTPYDTNCESDTQCSLLTNGACNLNSAGPPNWDGVGQWIGNFDPAARAVGGTYITYTFAEPVTPRRVEICHAAVEHQQALEINLQYMDANGDFQTFETLVFSREAEDRTAIVNGNMWAAPDFCGIPPVGIVCPPSTFCNFEDGDTGRCEPCVSCGAPDGCDTCRLPGAGVADCQGACSGNYLNDGSTLCQEPANPCLPGEFCDHAHSSQTGDFDIGGYCQPCSVDDWILPRHIGTAPEYPGCDGYSPDGCESCGLASDGVARCISQCRTPGPPTAAASITGCDVITDDDTLFSGIYTIENGNIDPFLAYCSADGFMKILQIDTTAYTPTTDAIGNTAPPVSGTSKLSDAQINSVSVGTDGSSDAKIFKLVSPGVATYYMFSNNAYVDTAPSMGLLPVSYQTEGHNGVWSTAANPDLATDCDTSRIDTECLYGNTGDRVFTDYSGVPGCYPDTGDRCFNNGAPTGHTLVEGFSMWVRKAYVYGAPCPWTSFPSTAAPNLLQCYDGTFCDASNDPLGWACCTSPRADGTVGGGRVRCPPNYPVLCDAPLACAGGTANCCGRLDTDPLGGSCADLGASPMGCPGTITSVTSRFSSLEYPDGFDYVTYLATEYPDVHSDLGR
eukprot:SAG11_NODE_46_length_20454_cov_11.499386_2_plen_1082_part_00